MLSYLLLAYLLSVNIVFAISLEAFLSDNEVAKTNVLHWLFIISLSILSPITLPMILRHKYQTRVQRTAVPPKAQQTPKLLLKSLVL